MNSLRVRRTIVSTALVLGVLGGGGCMAWRPGWQEPPPTPEVAADPAVLASRLAQADERFAASASQEDVLAAIAEFRAIVAADPGHYEALSRLGEAYLLLGAAYASSDSAKARAYREGIQWCERALATNPEFARLAAAGGMDAAVTSITAREFEAAFFWITGVSYYFKECLRGPAILVHLDWMTHTGRLLRHLESMDPDWGSGRLQFSLAIFYLGMPARYGGDMDKSARCLERAIALDPTSLLMRWGRAKYFHAKLRQPDAARDDLAWVLAQDPDEAGSPRRWNLYFQRDARAMVARLDR